MSLSGVNIACGYVRIIDGAAFITSLAWSQKMDSPGAASRPAAVPKKVSPGDPFSTLGLEIIADRDIWVSWGAAPDPTQSSGVEDKARILVRARELRSIFPNRGDLIAWAPA